MTKPAGDRPLWPIIDAIVRLRVWGRGTVFELPGEGDFEWTIGSGPGCEIRLGAEGEYVSRRHARLVRNRGVCLVEDLGGVNGIVQQGDLRLSVQLAPGVECEIGPYRLVAESEQLISLRSYMRRLIGWGDAQLAEVDEAVRGLRDMATLRATLVLCGGGDLSGVARRLHGAVIGKDRPFVVCGETGVGSLREADGGTLCAYTDQLPHDFQAILDAVQHPESKTRLVIVAPTRTAATRAGATLKRIASITFPPIAARRDEFERLLLAYADDAVEQLGAPARAFREHEFVWLGKVPLKTLAEVEELALRVVALRNWGVNGGARRLGISHPGFSNWMSRRGIPK